MYGGDEVSAIVVDLGSSTVKAGYAGEDTPKAVFPSAVGWLERGGDVEMKEAKGSKRGSKSKGAAGDAAAAAADDGATKEYYVGDMSYRRDGMEMCSPFDENGLLEDWDVVEAIWEHTLKKRLVVEPNEHPILMGEPAHTTREKREKMVELLFEKHNPPAIFLAKNPCLAAFATGRATALVVDCGGGGTTVSAVHDGYALTSAATRSPLGGDAITDIVLEYLEKSKKTPVRPRYEFKRAPKGDGESFTISDVKCPKTSAGYRLFKQREIAADLKETVFRLSDQTFSEEDNQNIPAVSYELPDGNVIDIGVERFKIPELLFQPHLISSLGLGKDAPDLTDPDGSPAKGLPALILETINKCDVDVRKDLFGGMILAGGGSLFGSLRERLEAELHDAAPTNVRVKVTASANNAERKFTTWIGGSILASLGSFQQMWMSKQEYEEHGATLIHRKCP
ncbi:actin superfamily [Micromonas pusilla CCMP1545]|uniref:Actin superfamily n=1 Tax=Micromonas pusilla (strain CCMP1545) TaxID=564608 RepID=C1MXP5_MICPC|nr:actin superfamily [Micromonas pusilla CCMP1545]EEH55496.1 actin superfamily [Micromonas pusilla CCMP1545]|eukprot:XP_003060727.1 actin superfamily [Micromonas pusilla CCMP1545]